MIHAGTTICDKSLSPPAPARVNVSAELWDVQSPVAGLIGAAVLTIGALGMAALAATRSMSGSSQWRYGVLLGVMFVAMAAYELGARRVHRRQFRFDTARPLDRAAWRSILTKCAGMAGSIVLAFAAFATLGEYGLSGIGRNTTGALDYSSCFAAFANFAPLVMLLSPVYFTVSHRHGTWSDADDEWLHLAHGYAALLRLQRPTAAFWLALRGLGVKFFFLPLMIVFWTGNTSAFEASFAKVINGVHGFLLTPANVAILFEFLQRGLILLDLALAVIGYACTMRLLDTHVRWAEPTLLGWMAALACYPPFSLQLTERYIGGVDSHQSWAVYCAGMPGLFTMCAVTILLLFTVYTASTVMFGLRFSNLTHRGVLCRGPYSVVRHPAYVSKNLAWWLISLPFLRSPVDCLCLLCWTALYVLRAYTEERHLMRDPLYREYARVVRWRFVPGVW